MAQLWTTGPAHWFVSPPAPTVASMLSAAAYLGTCEEPPDIDKRPAWEPVFNQLGGTKVPFDQLFEGEDALIDATVNRFNMPPQIALDDYVRTPGILAGGAATPGVSEPGDIGTLMLTESRCHVLIVVFPYTAKAAYAGQEAGYLFPSVLLEGNTVRRVGTVARAARLVWHAIRTLDMTVTNAYGAGSLTCYVPLTVAQTATLPALN